MQKIFLLCLGTVLSVNSLDAVQPTSYMQQVDQEKATFTLPPLPYAYDALEPFFDARTMDIHHNRHHATYVNNLNKSIAGTKWQSNTLLELFSAASTLPAAVRNNAGGHWNHSFYWSILKSAKDNPGMSQKMQAEIEKYFGSVDAFKALFKKTGLERLGSGWTWLIRTNNGALQVISTPNQDNPLMDTNEVRGTPLLVCDVWEHAYYLKYLNKRDDFLDAFWNVVNWQQVEDIK